MSYTIHGPHNTDPWREYGTPDHYVGYGVELSTLFAPEADRRFITRAIRRSGEHGPVRSAPRRSASRTSRTPIGGGCGEPGLSHVSPVWSARAPWSTPEPPWSG